MFFEDIGFTYFGPVDGHNIEKLESVLTMSKQVNGPVLIHVLTTKGKGYEIAEASLWFSKKELRDKVARRQYFDAEKNKRQRGDLYIVQILDEEIKADDPRLR